ncbi:hypothetical protein Pint_11625 [Pistacia integerrima]|uniref:Uncharacterized protein n=1 Tax=Pistacia integerrima TaxID=434235 RepID=A0ACC0XGY7_9ROSI|nr:hypothetical protein Pint_11625 [Pistacia integerrima]
MASHNLNQQLKEQFVSNLTGSSFTKIFVLLAIVPTSILLRQSFNSYHSVGKLNLNYQALVESLNKPELFSLDEFYRNVLLDTNSAALSTTSSTTATTTSATITRNLFHYLWTFFSLLKVNLFAKLTTDDFSARTPSWMREFLGFVGSYSFPLLPDTLELKVQENVKRYARNYATLFILFFAYFLLKFNVNMVPGAAGSSWVDLKFGDLGFVQDFISGYGVVKFKKSNHVYGAAEGIVNVLLTPTHLAIVMEYATSSELFARICSVGRFSEDEARFFFQQLISGVSYCHAMSGLLHSQPKSIVGTLAYIASEVLSRKEYDGKVLSFYFSSDFVCSNKHLVRIADGSMETFMRINK